MLSSEDLVQSVVIAVGDHDSQIRDGNSLGRRGGEGAVVVGGGGG